MNQANYTTDKRKNVTREPELNQMLGELGYLAQRFSVPRIAEAAGTSRQAIQYHVNRVKREMEGADCEK